MCMGSKPKVQKAPVVQAPPSRDTAAEAATIERRRTRQQQGVYGNVFTSVLGDPSYNANVQRPSGAAGVATLGA